MADPLTMFIVIRKDLIKVDQNRSKVPLTVVIPRRPLIGSKFIFCMLLNRHSAGLQEGKRVDGVRLERVPLNATVP